MSVRWTKRSRFALEEVARLGYVANHDGSITKPDGSPQKLCSSVYLAFTVSLVFGGKKVSSLIRVHRLVAYQKYGDRLFEDGMEVLHGEGGKRDNSWDNISIDTHIKNMMDVPVDQRVKRATHAGMKHAALTRRFTDAEEGEILRRREAGETQISIAVEMDVLRSAITDAARRAKIRRGDEGVSLRGQPDTVWGKARRKFTDVEEVGLLQWFEDKNRLMSWASKSKSLGVSVSTLSRAIHRARFRRAAGRSRRTG